MTENFTLMSYRSDRVEGITRTLLCCLLILLAVFHQTVDAVPEQIRGVIHLDSSVSGGEYEPEQLIQFLAENDMEVAVFTDQATTSVEYGIFPARWIMGWVSGWFIAKALDRYGSLQTYGAESYLSLLDELDQKYSDIVVIPGVESFPFYYWKGGILQGLTMVNGYKHLLAIGMDSGEDYEQLPSMGNGFFRGYGIATLFSLWPLVLIYLGLKCRKQEGTSRFAILLKIPAFLFLAIGFLFLLNNFPYKFGKYDQYHGDQGYAPYQDFIDYVEGRGGIVIWAHPEVENDVTKKIGPLEASLYTAPYHNDLLHTYNYTAFAAFYEGMKYVIPPGGVWDLVLTEYCIGDRAQPVWAIAEGDVEGDAFSPKLSHNVFLVEEKTRDAVMRAIRTGSMYAISGPLAEHLTLGKFTISGSDSTVEMGQTILPGARKIHVSATITCETTPKGNSLKAELIRDGKVVKTFKGEGILEIAYTDDVGSPDRIHYYRLDVRAPNQTRLLSNPIFIRPDGSS